MNKPYNKNTLDTKETQINNLVSFDYKKIDKDGDVITHILLLYSKTLSNNDISHNTLSKILNKSLNLKNSNYNNILSTEMKDNIMYFYLDTGHHVSISINSLKYHEINYILGGIDKEYTEAKVQKIQSAIENIYEKNHGYIFNGDINDDDRIDLEGVGKDLTLMDLKNHLDVEGKKLKKIYKITGETKKYISILKKEVKFYVGIGDKYEGGARYFSMSQKEINIKVRKLSNSMTIPDLINYIKHNNNQIDDNYKKSEMVNHVNTKFINSLYKITFDRLKNENADNRYFIDFVKAVTGRGDLDLEKNENYKKKTEFDYDDLDIDDDYKEVDIANKTLLFVMYRKGGILDEIKDKHLKDFKIEDEEVGNQQPQVIVSNCLYHLSKLNKTDPNYARSIFRKSGFDHLIGTNKNYDELSFDDKVSIGSIARIVKIIENASQEDLHDPAFLYKEISSTVKDTFDELNDSFSDNFDGWKGIFGGKDASDLGLSGEFAEIFELYQDINGNGGLFDLSDDFENEWIMSLSTAIVLGVGLIAGSFILGPFLVGAASPKLISLFLAGAKLGGVVGVTNSIVQTQGYDTNKEAFIDISSQIGVDSLMGGTFALLGLPFLSRLGNVNPDLFLSRAAWVTSSGLADKGLIAGEVLMTGMVVSPIVSHYVKLSYDENYFDTDHTSYHEQMKLKKLKSMKFSDLHNKNKNLFDSYKVFASKYKGIGGIELDYNELFSPDSDITIGEFIDKMNSYGNLDIMNYIDSSTGKPVSPKMRDQIKQSSSAILSEIVENFLNNN